MLLIFFILCKFLYCINGNLCVQCTCDFGSNLISCNSRNLTSIPVLRHKISVLHAFDAGKNQLTSLDWNIIVNFRLTLRHLVAPHNHIQNLPNDTFRQMTSLLELNLSWNEITSTLTFEHFEDFQSLDYLSLSHNRITCLKKNVFKSLERLTEFDLSYNLLNSSVDEMNKTSCFPLDIICDLHSLIVLRISGNNLADLFEGSGLFACLPNLTLLEASNCNITVISSKAFVGMNNLISLDLSDNFVSTWPSGALTNAYSLVYLSLGQNLIRELNRDFLKGNPKLIHLQIRNNKLGTLDYKWIENFGKVSTNDMTYSRAISEVQSYLTTTKEDEVSRPTLANNPPFYPLYIDWSGNPLVCNCSLVVFIGWFLAKGSWLTEVRGYHDLTCFETLESGWLSREVLIDGKINTNFLTDYTSDCAFQSTTVSYTYNNSWSLVNVSVGSETPFTNDEEAIELVTNRSLTSALPHISTIISVLVVCDALIYMVLVLLFKKRIWCKRRISPVLPMSTSFPTSSSSVSRIQHL